VSAQSTCSGSINGHTANWICEYGITTDTWPSGRGHNFLIGTNYSVYNQIQYDSGAYSAWASLGGQAFSFVDSATTSTYIRIRVIGGDGALWCRRLPYGGSWTIWYTSTCNQDV
jgi:hypothetical protein